MTEIVRDPDHGDGAPTIEAYADRFDAEPGGVRAVSLLRQFRSRGRDYPS